VQPELSKSDRNGPRAILSKLCATRVGHAWSELERTTKSRSFSLLSPKAKASLRRDLQRRLEQITWPCFELEWTSFVAAMESLSFGLKLDHPAIASSFLRDRPSKRLSNIFEKFPVLPQLWSTAVSQWRSHAAEILNRLVRDADLIARVFFDGRRINRIRDLQPGLSDPHHSGRSVTLLEFDSGCLIYKPRSGAMESAWFSLLELLNQRGFLPQVRAARILARPSYCWMEWVNVEPCRSKVAVRRFHERLGGMIAAAYLLKAVDCHRENVIAAGEHPILVDTDALWHVSPLTKTQSPADVLYRTGFLPNSRTDSLQSRSSVLGGAQKGTHVARLGSKYVPFASHTNEIVKGFARAWHCLVGTPGRAAAFRRKLRFVQSQNRRWIYCATERYAAILAASLAPGALRTRSARKKRITQLCSGKTAGEVIARKEIEALMQLDIPYFVRRTHEWMPPDRQDVPGELTNAIRQALAWNRSV
jgi:lantibiotic modifying enzyme